MIFSKRRKRLSLLFGRATVSATTTHEWIIDNKPAVYTLRRSRRRRRITLRINEYGIRVSAPWRTSQTRIEAMLAEHAAWISRKIAEWRERAPQPIEWRRGATVMLLGEPLTIVCDATLLAVRKEDGSLFLPLEAAVPTLAVREQVIMWLRAQARLHFEQRLAHYAGGMHVQPMALRLSNAKTRWGSCHPSGRVSLNWRLIQLPIALLDYVVVHELAHLLVPNHSVGFWRHVESVLPDYLARRRALRLESSRYLFA
jgi:predicted metal-dependent hydrolase